MARPAIALAFVLVAACGKDVEDPGFTASASATMSTTGTSTSGADETTTTGGGGMSMSNTGNADTTTDPDPSSAEVTGPTSDTEGQGCGDGQIMPGEQCDGADLQGFTCMSLGLNGGTLACDPVTCTFDTSMCMSTSGGTSG